MVRFQFNNIEEDVFIENRRSQVPSNVSVTFDAKPWTNTSLMGGFGTETPIDPQTKIVTRFMAGVSFSSSASFESVLTDGITTIEENQSKVSASEFSYAIGLGLKMDVSPGTTLLILGDYFASDPSFDDVEFTASQNGMLAFRRVFSFTQKIELINFSIGFAFRL